MTRALPDLHEGKLRQPHLARSISFPDGTRGRSLILKVYREVFSVHFLGSFHTFDQQRSSSLLQATRQNDAKLPGLSKVDTLRYCS